MRTYDLAAGGRRKRTHKSKNPKTLKLKHSRRSLRRKTRKIGGSDMNCEDKKCEYSADGNHKFGLVAWREYRCQNKNEKEEQCPCQVHD